MDKGYAMQDAAEWVRRQTGLELSGLGKDVAQILGIIGGGIHNAPVNVCKVDWSVDYPWPIRVYWRGGMSSWDRCDLLVLLVESYRRMVRVSIGPSNPHGLGLLFGRRRPRFGGVHDMLPEIRDVIDTCDGWYK